MNTKFTFALLIVLFASCNSAEKAPYTKAQYDSIMMQIQAERDAAVKPHAESGDVDKAIEVGKIYKARFDSVFAEQRKYYPIKPM